MFDKMFKIILYSTFDIIWNATFYLMFNEMFDTMISLAFEVMLDMILGRYDVRFLIRKMLNILHNIRNVLYFKIWYYVRFIIRCKIFYLSFFQYYVRFIIRCKIFDVMFECQKIRLQHNPSVHIKVRRKHNLRTYENRNYF
jgi:hypothetical protein